MPLKKVTISVDDATWRRAAATAARRNRSLSALVRQFLTDLANTAGDSRQLKREEAAARASIRSFRASNRLTRDDLHRRDR
jgi:hypothetical protein